LSLQFVENVAREIGAALGRIDRYHVVIVRSTVLPGTVEERLIPILEEQSGRRAGRDFGVSMNPEFLRESSAIEDYFNPSQIVIGEWDHRSGDVVQSIYAGIDAEVVRTTIRTAEMVKYVNNAFHALKIAFANEIGNLAKAHAIDGREVMRIFCQDRRLNISPAYFRPGYAFGGSCLPKDLRALAYKARQSDVECPLLTAVIQSNEQQIARGVELVEKIGRRKVGVLGLSFKAGTDDVRESPAVPLVETLLGRGYEVSVYDEHVRPERLVGANRAYLTRELPHIASLMRESIEELIEEADVIVIANDARSFRRVPEMARGDQVIIDLVGTCNLNGHANNGTYEGICW
jgi:GDP-mannose 6-dehydrogenase